MGNLQKCFNNTRHNTKMSDQKTINFYRQNDLYGELSNFYPSEFIDNKNRKWKTSEHYFQAMKFEAHPEHFEAIKNTSTPGQSAEQGRSRHRPLRADWEEVKDGIMMDALRYKFRQNESLKNLLMSTGGKKLVEHTKNDRYWGDGGDGSGKNMLGILLMELREEFKKPMSASIKISASQTGKVAGQSNSTSAEIDINFDDDFL